MILFQNETPVKPLWQKDVHQWDATKFITFSSYHAEVHSNDWGCIMSQRAALLIVLQYAYCFIPGH